MGCKWAFLTLIRMLWTNRARWDFFITETILCICAPATALRTSTARTWINFNFVYILPKFTSDSSWQSKLTNGWQVEGLAIYQSGQPFSVIDYSGAVGSEFYGVSDGIHQPDRAAGEWLHTEDGSDGRDRSGRANRRCWRKCFSIPLLAPGAMNGAIPTNDPYETGFTTGQRNIFVQSWQKRLDMSFVKNTRLTERFNLQYSVDFFNITNTPSFDIPIDDVTQNENFNGFPIAGTPALPTVVCNANPDQGNNKGFYNCPQGLGVVNKTIGSQRQMQMSLKLTF